MGMTLSDIHNKMYAKKLASGMTHKQAMDSFPRGVRGRVASDIQLTPFESHYGIKPVTGAILLVTILAICTLVLVVALST